MKNRIIGLFSLLFTIASASEAQKYASLTGDILKLDNGIITRTISLNRDRGCAVSASMKMKNSNTEFLAEGSAVFSFAADGKSFNGAENWRMADVLMIKDEYGGDGAAVICGNTEVSDREIPRWQICL